MTDTPQSDAEAEDRALRQAFIEEARENLDALERDIVALERAPDDEHLINAVFRGVHSIKGTSGFFGLSRVSVVTHAGESLLSRVRDKRIAFEAVRASALLSLVDLVRALIDGLEADGMEPLGDDRVFVEALRFCCADENLPAAELALRRARGRDATGPADRGAALDPPTPAAEDPTGVAAERRSRGAASRTLVPTVEVPAPAAAEPARGVRVESRLAARMSDGVSALARARDVLLSRARSSDLSGTVAQAVRDIDRVTTDIQRHMAQARTLPVETVWRRLPRVVRDVAAACGKQVDFIALGEDTACDRVVIEALADPLTHLIRNAIDHGIELPDVRRRRGKPPRGTLRLRASHEGDRVIIEVSDDGAGLDAEQIAARATARGLVTAADTRGMSQERLRALIFMPGFSTADTVTNISGRGVGLDAVKTTIARLGGTITVDTTPGDGTTFRLQIPVNLALVPALIVSVGARRFAVAQRHLHELIRAPRGDLARSGQPGRLSLHHRGKVLPLVDLGEAFGDAPSVAAGPFLTVLVVEVGADRVGMVVDALHDLEEIVVEPLGRELRGVDAFVGAAALGDGDAALVLDPTSLCRDLVDRPITRRGTRRVRTPVHELPSPPPPEPLLLFRLADHRPMAVALDAIERVEIFRRADITRADGVDAVPYRDGLLPLADVDRLLGGGWSPERGELTVLVHADGGRRVGFVVASVDDVIREPVSAQRRDGRPGIRASAMIRGALTELMDAPALAARV